MSATRRQWMLGAAAAVLSPLAGAQTAARPLRVVASFTPWSAAMPMPTSTSPRPPT
jgi:hypothetical protein